MAIDNFSAAYLHQRFDYNPVTNELRWNEKIVRRWQDASWNTRYAGQIAGRISRGRVDVALEGHKIRAHRIIWKMTYGEDTKLEIDHKNRDGTFNRLGNLREATPRQNTCNHGLRIDNTSGVTGVSWNKQHRKWVAYVHDSGGNHIHLGSFSVKEDAVAARVEYARRLYGEFFPS